MSGFIIFFKFLFSPIAAVFFELSKTLFYWKRQCLEIFDRFFFVGKTPNLGPWGKLYKGFAKFFDFAKIFKEFECPRYRWLCQLVRCLCGHGDCVVIDYADTVSTESTLLWTPTENLVIVWHSPLQTFSDFMSHFSRISASRPQICYLKQYT